MNTDHRRETTPPKHKPTLMAHNLRHEPVRKRPRCAADEVSPRSTVETGKEAAFADSAESEKRGLTAQNHGLAPHRDPAAARCDRTGLDHAPRATRTVA